MRPIDGSMFNFVKIYYCICFICLTRIESCVHAATTLRMSVEREVTPKGDRVGTSVSA